MTDDAPFVTLEADEAVCTITLNRPRARNPLSLAMIEALQGALASETATRSNAIVLRGEGPAFSAGHDLKEVQAHRNDADGGRAFYDHLMAQCADLMTGIARHPRPIIAEVAGIATAAGCQLVASCDLAIAGASARFATPGVNIGLFCSTPMVAVTRAVGRKAAMEMLLTGDMIGADKALEIGLVNKVTPDDELADAVRALAQSVTAGSAEAIAYGKSVAADQMTMSLDDAYRATSDVMARNLMADDADEGIDAFLTKRPPQWRSP